MELNINNSANLILEGIRPIFESNGFSLNKKHRQFNRDTKNSIQIFDLFFFKNGANIKIRPEIRIKIKKIDEIYRSITLIDSRPYLTLGNHLFEIIRYFDTGEETGKKISYDWLIENEDDIKKIIEIIPEYLLETILPYFEENSTVERVDYLLNKYPQELSIHNYLYPLRANIAIIAAKLSTNNKFSKLLEIYEAEIQEAEENYKLEFYKLKELLLRL
jgi:hypothetical protein